MNLKPRQLLPKICPHLEDRQAILLLGSRRSGKTSLLHLLMAELKKRNIPQSQILFFDLENQLVADQLNEIGNWDFFPSFLQAQGADIKKRVFVFLDEVQYLKNASSFIKYLVDHYPTLKFIVSGSASLLVEKVFSDSMVGRVWTFSVRPLSFQEFLEFKEEDRLVRAFEEVDFSLDKLKKISQDKLKNIFRFHSDNLDKLFSEFCRFGGYPEVVLGQTVEEKKELLAHLYSDYIRKDIQYLGKIRQITAYNNLVRLLSGQVGQLTNDSELASSLRISRFSVNQFLFLLEQTFIIKMLPPYSTNPRQEIIKASKVYFEDAGIVNLLNDSFQDFERNPNKGSLVENTVFTQLLKRGLDPLFCLHFWRTKQGTEVDFVIQQGRDRVIPGEVKYQSFVGPKIPLGLRSFIERYTPFHAFVATKDFLGESRVGKTKIFFFPSWLL